MQLTFATRSSILARWQTHHVMRALEGHYPGLSCSEQVITTRGDRIHDKPLPEIGGKGLFTAELEAELLAGRLQVAVHSLKDLPVDSAPGLTIGAVMTRREVRDVLVSARGFTLDNLPAGLRVGTSSLRRTAQLLALRPDIQVEPIRGNLDTRVQKVMDGLYEAAILAGAGLERLELTEHISQWLPIERMMPAPGQGALAIQCRADDTKTISILTAIDDPGTHAAVTAERQFLKHLGGGCAVPVGAYGRVLPEDRLTVHLEGLVASLDGRRLIRLSDTGSQPEILGRTLADKAIAEGAVDILARITSIKDL